MLDEVNVRVGRYIGARIAGCRKVVEAYYLARLIEHSRIEMREHLREIPAEEPARPGQHDGLAREHMGGVTEIVCNLDDVSLEKRIHSCVTPRGPRVCRYIGRPSCDLSRWNRHQVSIGAIGLLADILKILVREHD